MSLEIAGEKFHDWEVIKEVKRPAISKELGTHWLCRCVCGREKIMAGHRLSSGRGKFMCDDCFPKGAGGHSNGRSLSGTYNTWRGMRERCISEKHASYSWYGGRGISICDRWLGSFINFVEDMGERPKGMSLDRINPDGNYEPENCRWATVKQQSTNTVRGAITDEQKSAIIEIYKIGVPARMIADAVGIARGTVSALVSYSGYARPDRGAHRASLS